MMATPTMTTTAVVLAMVLTSAAVPGGVPAADRFLAWAPTPPMGWNSWDAFGTTITEAEVKAQADFMAEHLLPHGWRSLTVDIQWYEPGAGGHAYRPDAPLAMDDWGRLVPAPNRFPSAGGGAGFPRRARTRLHSCVGAGGMPVGFGGGAGIDREPVL